MATQVALAGKRVDGLGEAEPVSGQRHQVAAVLAVVDGEIRVQADARRVFAQQPGADGVEGAGVFRRRGGGRLWAEVAPQQALDAAVEFGRGAAREGRQHDALGVDAAEHEMGDAVRQGVGLAGAGARDHQQRRLRAVLDGGALRVVEAQVANRGGGHGAREPRLGFVRKGGVC